MQHSLPERRASVEPFSSFEQKDSFGRTISTGNFSSVRIDFSEEFYLDERTHGGVLVELQKRVDGALKSIPPTVYVPQQQEKFQEKVQKFQLTLEGKPYPVREYDNPFSNFFLNRICKGIIDTNPSTSFELDKKSGRPCNFHRPHRGIELSLPLRTPDS